MLCRSEKLHTSFLNSRIDKFFNIDEKLVDEQNGFRKGRSCQDHIFVFDSIVRNRLHENVSTYTALIDLQKPFDCVDRDFLFHRLLNAGSLVLMENCTLP